METHIITSVSEYLTYIDSLNYTPKTSYTVSNISMFRGQSNANWNLSPSLYRKGLFSSENLLLTELMHFCPNEFSKNRFDNLVKMQHFGLPTRLLDTTTNPLVALFFACKSERQKHADGAVFVLDSFPVSWSTDPLVDLIMDFVFDYYPYKMWLDQFLEQSVIKYSNALHRLMPDNTESLLSYLTIPLFAVMPTKTNARIEAQDGAFLVFGMKYRNREVSTNSGTLGRVYYNFDPIDISPEDPIMNRCKKIIIPSDKKEGILKSLDLLSINERKLFPDLSHQINYIVEDVTNHTLQ